MNYIVLNKGIHGQVVSLALPRRYDKPNSVFFEWFFQTSLKFRNLDLLLYFVQQEAELAPFWADYGKLKEEKKNGERDLPFIFICHEDPDNEVETAGDVHL